MVAIRAVAREVPVLKPADVRFGSKADIGAGPPDVRFTPKSGHQAFMSTRPSFVDSYDFDIGVGAKNITPRTVVDESINAGQRVCRHGRSIPANDI